MSESSTATPDAPAELRLGGNFPPASVDDWRALAAASFAGSADDVDTALGTVTEDGIALRPLYTADPPAPVASAAVRGLTGTGTVTAARPGGWDVRALHRDPDPVRTNSAILADLESGVTSLWLMVGEHGVAVDDLPRALAGVHLDAAPVVLDAGLQTAAAAQTLLALADEQQVPRAELAGSFGADPIGGRARWGAPADLEKLAALAAAAAGSQLCVATIDGTVYNDAGGSDSDELAAVASVAVAYVRAFTAAEVHNPFEQVEFRYAVGDDQFDGIAKLRAARRIWGRIAQLSGVSTVQRQHAVTALPMITRRDPWVNLLRATISCFSAAAGGAQAVTVLPFDSALGLPDAFARRIARNTQAVVHDESHLGRVADPAGGSWYVERLTEQLAATAWDKFTALESAGGAVAALESGVLGAMLAASAAVRDRRIRTRSRPITGVTAFADLAGDRLERDTPPTAPTTGLLPVQRYAAAFEALRDRAD